MIIDDDLLSREVLTLLAAEAGFEVSAFESGELALKALAQASRGATPDSNPESIADAIPGAILADMQMPGISGDSLARLLRLGSPRATLLAMSGTPVAAAQTAAFDHFLLKPFTIDDLCAALDKTRSKAAAEPPSPEILDRSIYAKLSRSIPARQLGQLYVMALDDAGKRIAAMREAVAASDVEAYKREAHAIKGGCGMVGAVELARLAAAMEQYGLQGVDSSVPPQQILDEFLAASQRLRRILDAQQM
jgi:CheY-like chemotaxis protein